MLVGIGTHNLIYCLLQQVESELKMLMIPEEKSQHRLKATKRYCPVIWFFAYLIWIVLLFFQENQNTMV